MKLNATLKSWFPFLKAINDFITDQWDISDIQINLLP